MTPAAFLPDLEACLRSRFAPFDAGELRTFVEAAWPLIADDPDAARWAGEFLAAGSPTGNVTG
jgi:hypothetical protein